jgi:hypothetical protein
VNTCYSFCLIKLHNKKKIIKSTDVFNHLLVLFWNMCKIGSESADSANKAVQCSQKQRLGEKN